jgi:hypothetical protein
MSSELSGWVYEESKKVVGLREVLVRDDFGGDDVEEHAEHYVTFDGFTWEPIIDGWYRAQAQLQSKNNEMR